MTETRSLPPLPPLAPSAPRAPGFARFHLWLYRVSGGRFATSIPGRRFLMLTTTGRKTGARYAI
ncbi:MAG TPA: nitroreductase/quinone reductase family protein, partial [Ktedonobacterales bacterium]|nr:nitroreductase/quinone reductase family protein [Ktedonobacterales bacterium]